MINLINSAICTLYKLDGFLGEDEYFKSNLREPITKQKEFELLLINQIMPIVVISLTTFKRCLVG